MLFFDVLIFGDHIDQGGYLISVLDGSEHRIVSIALVIMPIHELHVRVLRLMHICAACTRMMYFSGFISHLICDIATSLDLSRDEYGLRPNADIVAHLIRRHGMQGHRKLFLDRRLFGSVRTSSFGWLTSTQDNYPSPDVDEECQILKEVAHADTHDGTDHY